MQFKITFLLVIQLLAVTISTKTNKSKSSRYGDYGTGWGGNGGDEDSSDGSEDFRGRDNKSNDPIGLALIYCIKTNYFYQKRYFSAFFCTLNNRCPLYQSQLEAIDLFKQTISCGNYINTPQQTIKTKFITALQCVVNSDGGNKKQQVLVQKKKNILNHSKV
ncbi:hypothetical protein ABPG74_013626 [Tetrahymena malaccensis]